MNKNDPVEAIEDLREVEEMMSLITDRYEPLGVTTVRGKPMLEVEFLRILRRDRDKIVRRIKRQGVDLTFYKRLVQAAEHLEFVKQAAAWREITKNIPPFNPFADKPDA